MEVSEELIAPAAGSEGSEPGVAAELLDADEAVPEDEDAGDEEAAAIGCNPGNTRIKTAATRSHRGRLCSRSGRGGNADLLVDGTSDSMGS
jgi:hypothetical protein